EPSSELHIAEDWFRRTALGDLLGIADDKVNDDRLYRALDRVLPQKLFLELHLQQRLGRLFALEYDLLLYDITSTYFEGPAATTPPYCGGGAAPTPGRGRRPAGPPPPRLQAVVDGPVRRPGGLPVGLGVFGGQPPRWHDAGRGRPADGGALRPAGAHLGLGPR